MSVHVGYLDLHLAVVAQGVAWSPDVADDMIARVGKLFDQSLYTLATYGALETDDEEEDEFGPVPDKELVDPRTVYVEDDDNG
jgi:methenyltetrahydromethanopterin cyclohydrolase